MKKYLVLFICCAMSLGIYSQTEVSIPYQTLSNGVKMPILGFGTLELRDSLGVNCVAKAISLGYRLLDTAKVYENEEAVGKGIKKSGVDRKDLFVTTKIWVTDMGYENTKKAFEESRKKLDLEYIDLYLIHRPRGDIQGTWKAMEELYKAGKIKAIGVSNFTPAQLAELLAYAKVKPMVNQIETNPFFQQYEAQEDMDKLGIQMEAWSPLAQGRKGLFDNETLVSIAEKYGKSVAQVTLRWLTQRGIVAIPRTADSAYMIENLNIFDFELDDDDMIQIAALDLNTSQFPEWE